jgi:dienelactone hydrolase
MRGIKKLARVAKVALLGWVGLAAVAWLANGCVYTPVLRPPNKNLEERSPALREGLAKVALPVADNAELGGVLQAAGDGAPVVLHFYESGGLISPRFARLDDRYASLADLGCSSIAFDYRGFGRSSGERAPGEMTADALAAYEHAVGMAGGDESRVVLRGTSLGTIMVASLLQGGARPAAVVAFAPVEADTIARRYSQQFWWGWAYWPIAPFLRSITTAGTLEELARAECPVLVFTDPDDCFVTDGEVQQLQQLAGAKDSLSIVIPVSKSTSSSVRAAGFQRHMSVTRHAGRVQPAERRLLTSLFVEEPVFDARVSDILAALPDGPRAMLKADEAALRRLRFLAMGDRHHFPEAAAAAALMLRDDEVEAARQWVTSHWHRALPMIHHADRFDPAEVSCPAPFEELLGVFNLDNGPDTRWPVADILRARALLQYYSLVDGDPIWTETNVGALALALAGSLEEAAALAASADGPTSLSFEGPKSLFMLTMKGQGATSSRQVIAPLFTADLESHFSISAEIEGNGVLLPLLRKAAWLP